MLDDLARDDDVEPSLRREVRVDELCVVAEAHHVGDGDIPDFGQRGDVPVVDAASRAVDEGLDLASAEDVDRHLRHVELAAGTVRSSVRAALLISSTCPSVR